MNEYIESAINNLKLFKEPVCECPVCKKRKREGGLDRLAGPSGDGSRRRGGAVILA